MDAGAVGLPQAVASFDMFATCRDADVGLYTVADLCNSFRHAGSLVGRTRHAHTQSRLEQHGCEISMGGGVRRGEAGQILHADGGLRCVSYMVR